MPRVLILYRSFPVVFAIRHVFIIRIFVDIVNLNHYTIHLDGSGICDRDMGDWVITYPATCTEDGLRTRHCLHGCGHYETEPIYATGHNWGVWATTREPVCTTAGLRTRYCLHGCGHYETEDIPATGHDWGEWVVAGNRRTRSCRTCGTTQSHPLFRASAGGSHNMVIKEDGTLWAWGSSEYGQFGREFTGMFARIRFEVQGGTTWVYVSAGNEHTVAIREDGTLWAWGNRANGRLGDGETTGSQPPPLRIGTDNDWVSVSRLCQNYFEPQLSYGKQ